MKDYLFIDKEGNLKIMYDGVELYVHGVHQTFGVLHFDMKHSKN